MKIQDFLLIISISHITRSDSFTIITIKQAPGWIKFRRMLWDKWEKSGITTLLDKNVKVRRQHSHHEKFT